MTTNRRFRGYVTRGFSLSLTHDQIRLLVGLAAAKPAATAAAASMAGAQLLARGLIYYDGDEAYPTSEGSLVIGLLKSAGIYEEHVSQLE